MSLVILNQTALTPVGVDAFVRRSLIMCFERELLNIIVERVRGIDDKPFSITIAEALKEYADACLLGKSANNSIEEFESSNGCIIRIISGLHTFKI